MWYDKFARVDGNTPVKIDWDLILAFGEAENKPHNKDWIIRYADGVLDAVDEYGRKYHDTFSAHVTRKLTFRKLTERMYSRVDDLIEDVIHIPTNTSFRCDEPITDWRVIKPDSLHALYGEDL